MADVVSDYLKGGADKRTLAQVINEPHTEARSSENGLTREMLAYYQCPDSGIIVNHPRECGDRSVVPQKQLANNAESIVPRFVVA
jgi:hypothetical protein